MKRCPQCSSLWCGPLACRFSGITNARAAEVERENAYANATIKRDKVMPKWERNARQGAREPQ